MPGVDEQLAIRFANEDLSAALRLSTEEALRKRYEAEAANSAKTIFLANMSHELRTPLNAILGFADIIAQQAMGPGAAERYAEYAGDIHASGAHLLSLINDLLDVAKIEAGRMQIEPQPVDAARLIEEIRRLMAPRVLARGQSLHARVAGGLPLVMADERALRQIVLNLVSNAVKFTPQGGTITIRCGRPGSEGLLFEVEDDGPRHCARQTGRHLRALYPDRQSLRTRVGRHRPGAGAQQGPCRAALAAVSGSTARWAREPRSAFISR